jgi:hypothetical protein
MVLVALLMGQVATSYGPCGHPHAWRREDIHPLSSASSWWRTCEECGGLPPSGGQEPYLVRQRTYPTTVYGARVSTGMGLLAIFFPVSTCRSRSIRG